MYFFLIFLFISTNMELPDMVGQLYYIILIFIDEQVDAQET